MMRRRSEPIRLTDDGGTYVIECDRPLTCEQVERFMERWTSITGAKLIILDSGLRLARQRKPWWKRGS